MPRAAAGRPASARQRRRPAPPAGGPQAPPAPPLSEVPPVVLVGLRGAGKTTAGRALAAALRRRFVDLDAEVEAAAGRSIPDLFATAGEAEFRRLEAAALRRALRASGVVVATGGGVVERAENRALLAALPTVVHLAAPARVLAERVRSDAETRRPALCAGGPLAEAEALWARRAPFYAEVAAAVVDAAAEPEAVVAALLEAVAALEP